MASFELYLMDCATGHIEEARTLEADDDIQAMRLASEIPHRPSELWRGRTKVHRFPLDRIDPDGRRQLACGHELFRAVPHAVR